jgi:hypothetical protein
VLVLVRVAAGETGSVRPALQPVERMDEVGQRAARVGAGVASQLAGRRAGGCLDGREPSRVRQARARAGMGDQGGLGEEQWIEDRPMGAAMVVDVGASVAGVAAMILMGRTSKKLFRSAAGSVPRRAEAEGRDRDRGANLEARGPESENQSLRSHPCAALGPT